MTCNILDKHLDKYLAAFSTVHGMVEYKRLCLNSAAESKNEAVMNEKIDSLILEILLK